MGGLEDSDFLDLVYGAAVEPSLWSTVVERVADMVGGGGGVLLDQNQESGQGAAIVVGADPEVLTPYFSYFANRNVLMSGPDARRFMSRWAPRILTDEDWLPKETLVRSEYYNDYLRPLDIHSVLMIRLAAHGLNAVNLNIGRPERRGQFTAADIAQVTRYHSHLIRSFNLCRKLSASRQADSGASEVLDRSPYGVFLVGEDSRVRYANSVAEGLIEDGDGLAIIGGRLCSAGAEATRQLQALISTAACPDPERRTGGSMPLATPTRQLPLSVMVAPVASEGLAVFHGGPSVIVCVTDLEAGVNLPEQRLRDLFSLTTAEARIALALVDGRSPREVAESLHLSFYTVRWHMVHIFDKTGTKRQAELVRLMMRVIGVGLS
jgi:DNA-binding CsgD family transcriptional regulator